MDGDVELCMDRAPDFFALNRLEGPRWSVAVAEHPEDGVVGCIAVTERSAYVHGHASRICYVSDLKVHPRHRQGTVADLLTTHARDACARIGGPRQSVFLGILAGNSRMERRAHGPRGLPSFARFATVRTHAVPLLLPRRAGRHWGLRVRRAGTRDLEEMATLWSTVARSRQLTAVHDAESLGRWVTDAPSLALSDFLLAHRLDGRLAGFLGIWDQAAFKQLRVTRYSPRLRVVRHALNAAATVLGGVRLPAAGQPLRIATATHLCIAAGDHAVMRALVLHGCARLRAEGYAFLNVGLDPRDPLDVSLRGLFAQPTDAHVYVGTPGGPYAGPSLADRPLHFETALV
jgi:hypothetical protein